MSIETRQLLPCVSFVLFLLICLWRLLLLSCLELKIKKKEEIIIVVVALQQRMEKKEEDHNLSRRHAGCVLSIAPVSSLRGRSVRGVISLPAGFPSKTLCLQRLDAGELVALWCQGKVSIAWLWSWFPYLISTLTSLKLWLCSVQNILETKCPMGGSLTGD